MAEETNAPDKTAPAARSSADTPQPAAVEDRGIFVPLIFGGAVATALGFFAGQIDSVEARLGLNTDDGLGELVQAQAETLETQAATIAALTARLEDVAATAEAIPEVDLSGVTSEIAAQSDQITALADRIETVEKRPMTEGLSEDAIAAYQAELGRLQGAVEEQRAEIEALLQEARNTESSAEEKARIALARAAMSKIITAVNSGAPFADALTELQNTGGMDVPEALTASAEAGVPTLTVLQAEYPAAARAALAATRNAAGDGGGLGSFLQKQLGARSVTPREGNDPDAILSRAEAAVREGRVGDALTELDGLPDVGKAAMADWMSLAQTRRAASVAADELMTALATN